MCVPHSSPPAPKLFSLGSFLLLTSCGLNCLNTSMAYLLENLIYESGRYSHYVSIITVNTWTRDDLITFQNLRQTSYLYGRDGWYLKVELGVVLAEIQLHCVPYNRFILLSNIFAFLWLCTEILILPWQLHLIKNCNPRNYFSQNAPNYHFAKIFDCEISPLYSTWDLT